jgi:pimeloyl-ACP methyl ester carboxylesterase
MRLPGGEQETMVVMRGARVPLLALGLLAAAPAARPLAPSPPPAPPNGTYTYALSRNGGDQGTTTVVLYRRDGVREIETSETGAAGAARMFGLGAYRYADLGVDAYAGTYRAPFLRSSPLGRTYRFRTVPNFDGEWTVRYRSVSDALVASIDGTPIVDRLDVRGDAKRAASLPWILDAPFMTGALLLPAFNRQSREASLAPISEAFPSGVATAGQRLVRATPTFPKTPKNDIAVDVPGVIRVWFDPATYIVHEVHFTAANFDARLVSYVKGSDVAPLPPLPVAAPEPPLPREAATFSSADGTSLAALLARPAAGKAPAPAIVFVPPGPGAATDYDGDGPTPMFPALARAFVQRGYAVLRYDMRGVGKSGGSTATQTWDEALADAEAAAAEVAGDATLDPKRVYLLGYGNGADLALAAAAASAGGVPIAGVIALAPTVLPYRNCAAAVSGAADGGDATWRRSSLAHDPTLLAARAKAPLLVLHPGLPVCGETKDQVDAYDDRLREANPLATIVAANDLTRRFGGRYEAESPENTEAFFPYRFDPSTATAIADWLDNPKTASSASALRGVPAGTQTKPPPPPPGVDKSGAGLPNPHRSANVMPLPLRSVEPGVVLPSGMTPPPDQVAPPTPIPTPAPNSAPTPAPSAASTPAPVTSALPVGTPVASAAPATTPLPAPSATAN